MKNIYRVFLILIFIGLGFLFLKGYFYQKEVTDNGEETVCRYSYCEKSPKSTTAHFTYYIDGVFYKNSYGNCPNDINKEGKFFIVKYSKIDPNKIIVDFTKEITDTSKIINSGFKIK